MVFGEGQFRYELVEGWGTLSPEWDNGHASGIIIDDQGLVCVMFPAKHVILRMDQDGNVQDTLSGEMFCRAHSMSQREGKIYCTDTDNHVAYVFDKERHLLKTLGTKGMPSQTGAAGKHEATIEKSAGPFHYPTHIAASRDGSIFVTDGYGNARVHKFRFDGSHAFSWGEPGQSPGRFNRPRAIAISDEDILYVADSGNNRIQLFTTEGEFIEQWTDLIRPAGLFIGEDKLLYIGESRPAVSFDPYPSRVSIYNLDGKRQARLENPDAGTWKTDTDIPEGLAYRCVQSICADRESSIYVIEHVIETERFPEKGKRHLQNLPPHRFSVKKYQRRP